ncbi:MAG TPA: metal-dependent hydrolase [Thermoanaerobaculia bacterium]|nr:metal-dependent hydrolase [Burkholderiales bacterium]HYC58948.1 metal-dependent hydrolase [Thermoanaerobaculia bacterium]
MDTLTHALSGALIARATAPRTPRPDTLPLGRRMVVGFLATAFPDSDVLTSYLSPLSYLYHHRGITHSFLMLPLWAVLLAAIFAVLWRKGPSWRAYVGVTACGLATHIAGDLITSFGTMVFAPVSDARYALGSTFIIDLWFTGIIVAGLLACAFWRSSRVPAIAGMAVLVSYVAFQTLLREQAIDFGEAYARSRGSDEVTVTAQPRPVSPFNWTVILQDRDGYRFAHVNLIRKTVPGEPGPDAGFIERLDAAYRPLSQALWLHAPRYGPAADDIAIAREAYEQPGFRFFRWFAMYPAAVGVENGSVEVCAWFHDLRFVTPGRTATPFRYGMCRRAGGVWQPFQMVDGKRRAVY